MMIRLVLAGWFVLLVCVAEAQIILPGKKSGKKYTYKEVDAEEMIMRYIAKAHHEKSIEGIYSVSCVVIKKGRTLLSPVEREKIVLRKENYARVAILKDWPGSSTEYVELSLNDKNAPRYPIVAELSELAEGGGFIYRHFEPKGQILTFTFLYGMDNLDMLEGVFSEMIRGQQVTYKLTYLRLYPKNNSFLTGQK